MRKRIVGRVDYLQEMNRGSRSTKHKITGTHVVLHVNYWLRDIVVATFLVKLLLIAGEGKILIILLKFQTRQNIHDSNIVTLRETEVSWAISCNENINLIYHKLYALVHTVLREDKADSHIACRVHIAPMPFPCRSPAMPRVNSHMPSAPLPYSNSAVSFVKVRVVAGNIRTVSPTV
jgi:hypothetical protein